MSEFLCVIALHYTRISTGRISPWVNALHQSFSSPCLVSTEPCWGKSSVIWTSTLAGYANILTRSSLVQFNSAVNGDTLLSPLIRVEHSSLKETQLIIFHWKKAEMDIMLLNGYRSSYGKSIEHIYYAWEPLSMSRSSKDRWVPR